MLEILQFVMSDFWIFCGTVILLTITASGISSCINSIRGKGD